MSDCKIIVVGSGFMAREYLKVLAKLGNQVIVVGRGEERIRLLETDFPDFKFFSGGLEAYIKNGFEIPEFAINASSINQLKTTSIMLMESGVKYLMLEKPGELTIEGLEQISACAKERNAEVQIAYNRRFYSSIGELKKQVSIDGGITSAHFEFTEWVHTIDPAIYDHEALNKWIISNSSHVIDTVFALIGLPGKLSSNVAGSNNISWHPSGSIFTGSGISVDKIPFTYHSNWEGPGRWAIEISTNKRRFYLKPMEKLQQQVKGSVQVNDVKIDDQLDQEFKPGLFLQTQSFLNKEFALMISIDEQIKTLPFYYSIGGYEF